MNLQKMILPSMMLLGASVASAAVIPAGSVLDETQWVTNGYGSEAFIFFSPFNDGVNLTGGELAGGYLSANVIPTGDNAASAGTSVSIQSVDGLSNTLTLGTSFDFGLGDDSLVNNVTFTVGADAASLLRVGVLVGGLEAATSPSGIPDVPQSIGVALNGDIASVATIVPSPGPQADWYFFDLIGVAEGDTITVSTSRVADAPNHRFNPVSGVVFSVIPEPSVLSLFGIGLMALFVAQRRRK